MKTFTRTIENFICENCGKRMQGNGYTNHCSNCLCSKHVDINPGDRKNSCGGLMAPIEFDEKKGLLHRCKICKFVRYNKLQPQDNYEKIIQLSASLDFTRS